MTKPRSPRSRKVTIPPAKSDATVPPMRDTHAALTALAALYQGEKTDAAYVFNTGMALMGVAVVYLVAAIPFVGTLSHGPFAWLFLLLLPMPLWLVSAFHSLITLNAMRHGVSVQIIEDELFDASELRVERGLVGSASGDRIMDITKAKPIHIFTTFFVYVGVGLLIIGFTVYALYSSDDVIFHSPGSAPAGVITVAKVTYSLVLLLVGLSWFFGLRMIKRDRDEIATHVNRFGTIRD